MKNKNIDHRVKEHYAMFGLPIQNENSAINDSLPFLFDFFELKEKYHIRRQINSQKKSVYMRNQSYFYFYLAKIKVGQVGTTKKLSCLRLIKKTSQSS